MRLKAFSLLCLTLLCTPGYAQTPTPSFTFTTIDVSGAQVTRVNGVSVRGDIVGRYSDSSNCHHGFLLTAGGTLTSFDVGDACRTAARAINARGEIAGRYKDSSGVSHGLFRASTGAITTFDVPASFGADGTEAQGINDLDQIVGDYTVPTNVGGTTVDVPHGFLLNTIGGFTNFTKMDCPGTDGTIAAGIDDQGDIVGGCFTLGASNTVTLTGFLLTNHGSFSTVVVPFAGALNTVAVGINEEGDIAGIWSTSTFDLNNLGYLKAPEAADHAFLLAKGGSFVNVDVSLSGVTVLGTFGKKINPEGSLVGTYTDSSGFEHGFLATPVR